MNFAILALPAFYCVYRLFKLIFRRTALRSLPGPDVNPSWFFGHTKSAWLRPPGSLYLEWLQEHSHVLSFRGLLSVRHSLFTFG